MAKCLVLGANGFIGSHLVDSLVADGHSVRAFDRFRGSRGRFLPHENIEEFNGDFMNRNDLANALKGIEYVFHLVSTTTPASAEDDPLIDIETNIRMSIELFQECVNADIKRLIFSSTGGAIYGVNEHQPHNEADVPLPISPYAIGKLTIEHYLRYFRRKYGLKSTVFRISNPYGERQPIGRKQGVIPIFLERLADNLPITVLGDGTMVRDYIYVKDVARIIAKSTSSNLNHHIYNLGSGSGVTVNELVKTIQETIHKEFTIEYQDSPVTYVHEVVLDTERLKADFPNDVEMTSMREGIKRTWDYVVSERA